MSRLPVGITPIDGQLYLAPFPPFHELGNPA